MHKRLKLQKAMIAILAVVIAFIAVVTLLGRNQTVEVVVIDKEVDLNKTLDEQLKSFKLVKMSKRDYMAIGDHYVTSLDELKNQYLQFKLEKGSIIPVYMLDEKQSAGEFAAAMSVDHTIFKIIDGVEKLPLGVSTGDRINIALTATVYDEEKEVEKLTTGVLLRDVVVYSIDETDVFVKVTEQENLMLANAEEIGRFVLQLPGKKVTLTCKERDAQIALDVKDYIKKKQDKDPDYEADIDALVAERIQESTVDCLKAGQQATTVDVDTILDIITNGTPVKNETSNGTTETTPTEPEEEVEVEEVEEEFVFETGVEGEEEDGVIIE